MVHEKWFISDTHFFHENIIHLCGRPFANAELMNENLIHNWNKVVGQSDFVYHLGDVFIGGTEKDRCNLLWALNGRKRLIVGNHDESFMKQRGMNAFEKISLWKDFKDEDFTCTHIPGILSKLRDGHFNVHGHTHNKSEEDKHYINVCVEVRDYFPVHIDTIVEEIKIANQQFNK